MELLNELILYALLMAMISIILIDQNGSEIKYDIGFGMIIIVLSFLLVNYVSFIATLLKNLISAIKKKCQQKGKTT